MTAGYLDVSNYNPFEANISTVIAGEEKCDDKTENEHDEHDANIGVEVDDCPVIVNAQSPSEDGSPCDDSLLWIIMFTAYCYMHLLEFISSATFT